VQPATRSVLPGPPNAPEALYARRTTRQPATVHATESEDIRQVRDNGAKRTRLRCQCERKDDVRQQKSPLQKAWRQHMFVSRLPRRVMPGRRPTTTRAGARFFEMICFQMLLTLSVRQRLLQRVLLFTTSLRVSGKNVLSRERAVPKTTFRDSEYHTRHYCFEQTRRYPTRQNAQRESRL